MNYLLDTTIRLVCEKGIKNSIDKMWTSILIADLLILQITDAIHVGVGISDITGPAGGTPMVTFIKLPTYSVLITLL